MGKKYVLVDDYDGEELPEDTKPISLSVARKRYALYLSDDNYGKLLEVLEPFIKDAEIAYDVEKVKATVASADKEKLKNVREWAQAAKYEYTNAKGEKTTLGDRGRIPQEVIDAYDKANPN